MKKYIITTIAVFLIAGCDVLDKVPLTGIVPEKFYNNVEDAEAAVASAYDALQSLDYYGWPMHMVGEMPSDNCDTQNGDVIAFDRFTWSSTSGTVREIFFRAYIGINRTNAVIKYIPTIGALPTSRRDEMLGEAYFLRALHYFNLVRLYGEVPLRLDPVESGDTKTVNIPRTAVSVIYAQIKSDLILAKQLTSADFGDNELNRGRVTKIAVSALKAKVHLTLREWGDVLTEAQIVLNSPNYSFSPDFASLFPPENQAESIFELQFSGTAQDGGNALPDLNLPTPPATYSFQKFNIPTAELVTYVNTSVGDRRWSPVGSIYGGINRVSLLQNPPGSGADNGFFELKHKGSSASFVNSSINYVIIRMGDVKLMQAEAANEQTGPSAALTQLNDIRLRAGLSALTVTNLPTKQAARAEIDRQRRLELAFEGERWFDLLRYQAHEEADPSVDHPVTAMDIILQKRPGDATELANRKFLLLPMHIEELNRNPAIVQTPGY
jgi:starch-binding outer membrane protein, SusD/RagB family